MKIWAAMVLSVSAAISWGAAQDDASVADLSQLAQSAAQRGDISALIELHSAGVKFDERDPVSGLTPVEIADLIEAKKMRRELLTYAASSIVSQSPMFAFDGDFDFDFDKKTCRQQPLP